MRSYISTGDSMQFTAPVGGVVSGQPYIINNIVGVVMVGAKEGEKFVLKLKGAFAGISKVIGQNWDIGDALYLTPTSELTTISADGIFFGNAYYEAEADEVTGSVILVQSIPFSGSGSGDLSNYYTKSQIDTSLLSKADAVATATALSSKVNASSIAQVAISGSYNDLLNKPVPFVGPSIPSDVSGFPEGQLFIID